MPKIPRVSIIVAMSKQNRAIGKGDKLLWHIPDDLKRFKALTSRHPVIMGRKTFESVLNYLGNPLPNRTNIVVTRDKTYHAPEGVIVSHSVPEAISKAQTFTDEEVFIGGGGQIYKEALPATGRLYLTLVENEPEADSFFPEYNEFRKIISEERKEHNGLHYTWLTLER